MTGLEMQVAFEIEADIIDSISKPLTTDIFYYINNAVDKFIRTRYSGNNTANKGFEETQKRIDDLRALITESTIITTTGTLKPNSYVAAIPSNYFISVAEECEITYTSTTSTSRQGITQTTMDRYSDDTVNPFSEHIYHNNWARPLRLFYASNIELISDGTYTVNKCYLRYIKKPAKVSLSVSCDLAESVHPEIIRIAVELFLENRKDARYETYNIDNKSME